MNQSYKPDFDSIASRAQYSNWVGYQQAGEPIPMTYREWYDYNNRPNGHEIVEIIRKQQRSADPAVVKRLAFRLGLPEKVIRDAWESKYDEKPTLTKAIEGDMEIVENEELEQIVLYLAKNADKLTPKAQDAIASYISYQQTLMLKIVTDGFNLPEYVITDGNALKFTDVTAI